MIERPNNNQGVKDKLLADKVCDIKFKILPVPAEVSWRLRRYMPRHGINTGKR